MKLFLAGSYSRGKTITKEDIRIPFVLESFYYIEPWQLEYIKKPFVKSFILDSGAFTYMNQKGRDQQDIDQFTDQYIQFIKNNKIDLFFEMDVDRIYGIEKTVDLREKIERETGKKSIPVWHVNRGKDDFVQMCQEYDYVAFGAFLTDDISTQKLKPILSSYINTAHKYGAKIHGLGFTPIDGIEKYPFDSVDSKTWLAGSFAGCIYQFNGCGMNTYKPPDGHKRGHYVKFDIKNLEEWIKYANYLERKRP